MLLKTKRLLLIIGIVILLAGLAGYFYWQFGPVTEKEASQKQAAIREEIKNAICSGQQEFNNKVKPKDIFNQDFLTGEQVENLRDYYFCQGLLNNNFSDACDKKIYLKDSEEQQCQSGFYFSAMVLASLRGEKERTQEICQKNMSGGALCEYIANLDELVKKDGCSQLVGDDQKICYAFFGGEEKYCSDLDSARKDECAALSKFLKILKEGDKNKCDSLRLKGETTEVISNGAIRKAVVSCKLYFDNSSQTCDAQYAKFAGSVCDSEQIK